MSNVCRTRPPVAVQVAKPPPRNYVVRMTVYRRDNTTIDLDSSLMTEREATAAVDDIIMTEAEARTAISKAGR